MVDVCNKVGIVGLRLSVKLRVKELERKMRKRLMKEGVEEVVVIGSEVGEIEVYNAKIGVCRIKSEREYDKGTLLRIAIYKVEEKTKIAVVPPEGIQ
jgi:hypothetical protein